MPRLDEIDREVSVHALASHWKALIESASTETELTALARRFLANEPPSNIARLPGMRRTRRLAGPNDVSLLTFRLRRLSTSHLTLACRP